MSGGSSQRTFPLWRASVSLCSVSCSDTYSVDRTTGCTPLVLAIRHNHPPIVRELLSAGAVIPPPGLTSDPHILSILYPQPLYSSPYYPSGDYYPQPPFFDPRQNRDSPTDSASPTSPHSNGTSAANLPPADVAKTIPCRNYPNCKYGSGCHFYHPPPQRFLQPAFNFDPSMQGFYQVAYAPYPTQPQQPYRKAPEQVLQSDPRRQNGSETMQTTQALHSPHMPPIMQSPVHQHFSPQQQVQLEHNSIDPASVQQPPTPVANESNDTQHVAYPASPNDIPNMNNPGPPMSPSPPMTLPLIPNGHYPEASSPTSPHFAHSAATGPMMMPPDAYYAQAGMYVNGVASPYVTGTGPMMLAPMTNGYHTSPSAASNHVRRQSFNTFGIPQPTPKPFGHAKKLSFSGGQRPFNRGPPPPCAFFAQGKCRNGEYCKFPHLDPSGNDCRHPDVVRGLIPPLPTLARQRNMRMVPFPGMNGYGAFDPTARPSRNGFSGPDMTPHEDVDGDASPEETAKNHNSDHAPHGTASLPAKPAPPVSAIPHTVSSDGIPRATADSNGSSQSLSPAPSAASFSRPGRPRPTMNGHVQMPDRSPSADPRFPQRVPRADEFPALKGRGAMNGDPAKKWDAGKTAAQVLSEPAPITQNEGEPHENVSAISCYTI